MNKSIRSIKDILNYSLDFKGELSLSNNFLKLLKTAKFTNFDYIVYSKKNNNDESVEIHSSKLEDIMQTYDYFKLMYKSGKEDIIKDDFLRCYEYLSIKKYDILFARYKEREKSFMYLDMENFCFYFNKNGKYIEEIIYEKNEEFSFDFKEKIPHKIENKEKGVLKKINKKDFKILRKIMGDYLDDIGSLYSSFNSYSINIDGISFNEI